MSIVRISAGAKHNMDTRWGMIRTFSRDAQRRAGWIAVSAALIPLLITSAATAQYPGNPYQSLNRFGTPTPGGPYGPGLSPYLNLLRGGNPAVNYYNGVLSERDRRFFQQQAGQSILGLEQEVGGVQPGQEDLLSTLPGTGHPTAFGYSGAYFPPTAYPGRYGPGGVSNALRPRR
jgi:hypothetical protein